MCMYVVVVCFDDVVVGYVVYVCYVVVFVDVYVCVGGCLCEVECVVEWMEMVVIGVV